MILTGPGCRSKNSASDTMALASTGFATAAGGAGAGGGGAGTPGVTGAAGAAGAALQCVRCDDVC